MRDRTLASEPVQAVALTVPFVAELFREASRIEVRAARAVLVDDAVVCEFRPLLVVELRKSSGLRELKDGAEENVRVGRTAGDVDDRLVFDDGVDADGAKLAKSLDALPVDAADPLPALRAARRKLQNVPFTVTAVVSSSSPRLRNSAGRPPA